MNTIYLKKKELNFKEFKMRSALESDCDTLITEDTIVIDEDTKEVVAVYAHMSHDTKPIMAALEKIKYPVTTRTNGLKTTSRIFGYMPRVAIRNDFCSSTSLARDYPKEHAQVCNYGKHLAKLYSDFSEETYRKHLDTTETKVLNEYRIPDTPFTSGIINKNNPLKYHFDSGNFKAVYSCMVVFKHKIKGGYLAMPEYGVMFECADNTAMMFDGQEILHGVTPIKKESEQSRRYSIVYYSLQQIWNCLPLDEEIARLRNKKYEVANKRLSDVQKLKALDEELADDMGVVLSEH
jgi:hypothetical protein